MAKIIKYQRASEMTHPVVVKVPQLDEEGNLILVEEIRQEVERIFTAASIKCDTEAIFQANLPIAQAEAYNGEYTIEDDGEPEPVAQETTDDVLDALLGVTE